MSVTAVEPGTSLLDVRPDSGAVVPDALDAFLAKLAGRRLLRADEERAPARRIERGDLEAKRMLIEANLRLERTLGRSPTVQEVAAYANLDPDDVARITEAAVRPASLDEPLYDDTRGGSLGRIVSDTRFAQLEATAWDCRPRAA